MLSGGKAKCSQFCTTGMDGGMSIWDVKVKLPLHALPIFSLTAVLGPGTDGGGDGSFPDLCGCVPSVGIRTLPSFVLGPRWVWGVCRTVETQPVHSLLAELGVSLEGPEDQMSCGVPPSSQLLGKKERGWGG